MPGTLDVVSTTGNRELNLSIVYFKTYRKHGSMQCATKKGKEKKQKKEEREMRIERGAGTE